MTPCCRDDPFARSSGRVYKRTSREYLAAPIGSEYIDTHLRPEAPRQHSAYQHSAYPASYHPVGVPPAPRDVAGWREDSERGREGGAYQGRDYHGRQRAYDGQGSSSKHISSTHTNAYASTHMTPYVSAHHGHPTPVHAPHPFDRTPACGQWGDGAGTWRGAVGEVGGQERNGCIAPPGAAGPAPRGPRSAAGQAAWTDREGGLDAERRRRDDSVASGASLHWAGAGGLGLPMPDAAAMFRDRDT